MASNKIIVNLADGFAETIQGMPHSEVARAVLHLLQQAVKDGTIPVGYLQLVCNFTGSGRPYKRPRKPIPLCDPREVHRVVVWFGKNGLRMLPSDAYGVFKERFDLEDAYADLVKLRDTSFKPATRFSMFHASVVTYDRLLGPPEYIEREKIFEIDDVDQIT